jgi:hypothetical protein
MPKTLPSVACKLQIQIFSDHACTQQATSMDVVGCTPGNSGSSYAIVVTPPSSNTCPTQTPTLNAPDASVTEQISACSPATSQCQGHPECSSMPRPLPTDFNQVCVFQNGVSTCTDSFYSVQHVVYADKNDQRSCASCVMTGTFANCGTSADYTDGTTCGTTNSINFGDCLDTTSHPKIAVQDPNSVSTVTCSGTTNLVGAFQTIGAVTFCCAH